MKTKTIYFCETCGYESDDLKLVQLCEKRVHFNPDAQFATITKEIIESFRPRLEAIRNKDKRAYVDGPYMGVYSALYCLFTKGQYTILESALKEIERLYG
jgi:hypothetical protein